MPPLCTCSLDHRPRIVVLTGGPGAGKTAVLEVVQRQMCPHITVLPEAASILWRGEFPRRSTVPARKAAQRAIVRLQFELLRMVLEEARSALIVADRGTLDGLAYWPGTAREFFADLGTTKQHELARYATVIHMRTPPIEHGYTTSQFRIETAAEAAVIDARIAEAWSDHPRLFRIESCHDFVTKLGRVLALLRAEAPACCRIGAAG